MEIEFLQTYLKQGQTRLEKALNLIGMELRGKFGHWDRENTVWQGTEIKSDVAVGQGTPKIVGHHHKLGRGKERLLLEPSEGGWFNWYSDS